MLLQLITSSAGLFLFYSCVSPEAPVIQIRIIVFIYIRAVRIVIRLLIVFIIIRILGLPDRLALCLERLLTLRDRRDPQIRERLFHDRF